MDTTKKLSSFYEYKRLSRYEGLHGVIPIRAPTTYVGVELELEKVSLKNNPPSSFTMVNDGSLKLSGKEFVTVPIRFCYLEQELNRLFSSIGKPLISSRCSVHIHLNVRDFTQQELYRFILLYLIFERSLFNFSGGRDNNIFCTPLFSYLPMVKQEVNRLREDGGITRMEWKKYYALNLNPIWGNGDEGSSRLGTVEFRHMAGTTDVTRILDWISLIVSLKIAAKKFTTEDLLVHISTMNTTSGYNWLVREVFRDWCKHLITQPTFKRDVEAGILMAKLVALQPIKPEKKATISLTSKGAN